VIVFMACSRNGYVCCPSLHQSYTSGEIITLLKRIRCKAFFTTPGYGSDAATQPITALLSDVPTLIRTCLYGATFADATQTIEHQKIEGQTTEPQTIEQQTIEQQAASDSTSAQDRLLSLHLGHHRFTKRGDAQRQHLAGEWPHDGA
jgi:hypothetical protein